MNYAKMFRKNWRHPICQTDIDKLEQRLCIELPKELSTHYLQVNGGIPKKQKLKSDDDYFVIHGIMPLRTGDCHASDISLEDSYKDLAIERKVLRKSLLPFAYDEGGNLFCCSLRKLDFGKVYFVTNEEMISGEPFQLIAKSFADLVQGLY